MSIWKKIRGRITGEDKHVYFEKSIRLLDIEGFRPCGFEYGIELLNDANTELIFVIGVLQKYIGINRLEAIKMTEEIEKKGGIIIKTNTLEEAKVLVENILGEAEGRNSSFVCRAIHV